MGIYHNGKPHDIPIPPNFIFEAFKHGSLAMKWNFFHLTRKKLGHRDLKDFLNYECESYLKQLLTLRNVKSLLLIATQLRILIKHG